MNMSPLLLLLSFTSLQTALSCTHGDLRIVGGLLEGRVDMCYGQIWRPLCGDYWTISDYTVACRQLGFSDEDAVGLYSDDISLLVGLSEAPVMPFGYLCTSDKQSLLQCSNTTIICAQTYQAGVKCQYHENPVIVSVSYERNPKALKCNSIGGLTVSWSREGTLINGTSSQRLINPAIGLYENTLTIEQGNTELEGNYICTVTNRRDTTSALLEVPFCDDGQVLFADNSSIAIRQICRNSTYHDIELTTSRSAAITAAGSEGMSREANAASSTVALGILVGLLAVMLLATVMAFGMILSRLKWRNLTRHYDVPADRPVNDDLQDISRSLNNQLYEEPNDDSSMTDNAAYHSSSTTTEEKPPVQSDNLYEITGNVDLYEFPEAGSQTTQPTS